MRLRDPLLAWAIFVNALFFFFAACNSTPAPSVCPGYELTAVGSGCRDVATGSFVDKAKCTECDAP